MSAGTGTYTQDKRIGKLTTDLGKDALLLLNLTATERLSESYTVTVDAFSETPQPLHTLLGTPVGIAFDSGDDANVNRDFAGVLWEYSETGRDRRGYHYRLVLRPTMEFLTLNRRNRIFQGKSVSDIVKSILVGTYEAKLTASYDPVEYCVQYQESDFDFVSRLMEYDGIYYFYEHKGTASKLIVVDDRNAHADMTPAQCKVLDQADRRPDAPIWSVTERRGLGPTKVTVADYDFEMPSSKLEGDYASDKPVGVPTGRNKLSQEGTGGSWSGKAEIYDFPGKVVRKTDDGGAKSAEFSAVKTYGTLWLDAHRRRMARSFADGALFSAKVGHRLKLEYDDGVTTEYLIVATSHDYVAPPYDSGEGEETFLCSLELMPAAQQYRPPLATPRPRVLGPQTAVVVGPAGEEIYTDKYGRVKVQFHWDREGKKDESSSCFIRVMHAVAGQAWGSFALPRIGQEVVIEFLDGDPDRPLVTGAVYNKNNMPPVNLPDDKTQHGLRTRSSKNGGGNNHLWYEDKKGSEVVWFRAQKDYKMHVVDADEERQYDAGNRKVTFKKGNDELFINAGNRTETIYGDDSKTITSGNLTDIVKKGDETHTVEMGNRTTNIKMGNETLKVDMGNIDVKAALGKISMEAMQSIELKVGGSSIVIDQIGITIKGTVKVEIKGVMVQSSADAMQVIKGGLVMIN